MNAGAFSDQKVVDAAQLIVPILVDCSEKGAHEELQTKYGVRGYPTVLYVDPEGKKVKEMESREAAAVVGDIQGLAKKYPGRPSMWQNSVKGALEAARKGKKPVALYVAEDQADLLKLAAKVAKDVGDRKGKYAWVLEVGRKETLAARGLEAAPVVLVLDPAAGDPLKEPLEKIEVKAGDKAEVLNKALDEAAKKLKK